jgi:phage FluMu gp28-like protein
MKKIKKTPIIKTPLSKKSPVRKKVSKSPLLLIKKEPLENIEDYNKVMEESEERARKQLFKSKISDEVEYIQNFTQTNLEPTVLYRYQRKFMLDRSKFRHEDKSRQIGASYSFACEGYAKCQLMKIYTGIFVSYNQEEANEKIRYAKALYDSTPHKYRKKLIVDRVTALEWEGKLPDGRIARTRLISHPQREPRGKGFNTDVFLDELAHYQWQEKVYIASVPIVTRGLSQLAIASTPLGQSGLFHEIGHNKEEYSEFSRHRVFWWNNPYFLNEDALRHGLKKINKLAKQMTTEDRVLEFGNVSIRGIFRSMMLEFFQQEYELRAIDEAVAFIPLEMIKQCTFEALLGEVVIEQEDEYGDNITRRGQKYPNLDLRIYKTVEELSHAISQGKVTKNLVAGYDIGRKGDSSEIMILEEIPSQDFLQIERLNVTLKNATYRTQFNVVEKMFTLLPIRKMKVDSTGIGDNLSEDLKNRFRSRIEDVKFTNENKGDMASNLKIRFEDQSIAIANDRDLIGQIHSIKRKVTENAIIKYEVPSSERRKHHGDKFWALALASISGQPAQMYRVKLFGSDLSIGKTIKAERLLRGEIKRVSGVLPSFISNYRRELPPDIHSADLAIPPFHQLH